MSDAFIWQKRFRHPAILTDWERAVLQKVRDHNITPEEVAAWQGFEAFDMSKDIAQLEVDGWVVLADGRYQLAPDAPEFNVHETV